MDDKPKEPDIPSEIPRASDWMTQERTYRDCRRYWLDVPERVRWVKASSPLFSSFQIFSCGQFVEAWGHMWERQAIPEGVLIYCVDGKGYYQTDERDWAMTAGDLLYAPPNTHHLYWADGRQPWSIYWMHIAGSLVPHYEQALGLVERGPIRRLGLRPEIVRDFDRLLTNIPLSANDETRWLFLQTSAQGIFGHIASLPQNMAEIVSAYDPVKKAIALMDASLAQPFDMGHFAREAGCSERHFQRQFRKVTGRSPAEWFTTRKMHRAGDLLAIPNILVKEVADRLGYEDPLYFSRVFKRVIGLSPEEYRRRLTEDPSSRGVSSGSEGKG